MFERIALSLYIYTPLSLSLYIYIYIATDNGHIYIYIYIYRYIYIYMYVHIHTIYIYIYIYTHTHTLESPVASSDSPAPRTTRSSKVLWGPLPIYLTDSNGAGGYRGRGRGVSGYRAGGYRGYRGPGAGDNLTTGERERNLGHPGGSWYTANREPRPSLARKNLGKAKKKQHTI